MSPPRPPRTRSISAGGPAHGQAELVMHELRRAIDAPLVVATVAAAAESADTRRITLSVRDRRGNVWKQMWSVAITIADTPGGDPAVMQTAAWVNGYVLATIVPHGGWIVRTLADGTAQVDITISGAASRVFQTCVLGGGGAWVESEEIEWA